MDLGWWPTGHMFRPIRPFANMNVMFAKICPVRELVPVRERLANGWDSANTLNTLYSYGKETGGGENASVCAGNG